LLISAPSQPVFLNKADLDSFLPAALKKSSWRWCDSSFQLAQDPDRWSCQHIANWPPGNNCLDTRTHQNTISSEIEINYPFHPLFRTKLKVVRKSKTKYGTLFVDAPKGFCKEIPGWMTEPQCADHHISKTPNISLKAILRVIELLEYSIDNLIL
jgi:hypothetical protein